MGKTFAGQRFTSLLLVGTFSMLLEYLIILTDNIIVGNFLGEQALSAITLLSPFFFIIVFLSILISAGTAIIISYEMGKNRQECACRFFGQGIILAVAAGLMMTAAYAFILDFLGHGIFDVSAAVGGYMRAYFKYLLWLPLPLTLISLLYTVIMNDGNEKLCAAAAAVNVCLNVGLSIVLCRIMGIGGVSLASVISNVIQLFMLLLHFNGKRNTLRFVFYLNVRDTLRACKYSVNESGTYLFMAVMQLVINMFLLKRFGESAVVVFAVIANLFVFLLAGFDGIGQAVSPLINVYLGEGNQKSIVKLMKTAGKTALIEGVAVMAALLIFAGLIPGVFGISEPELIKRTVTAIRIFAVSAPVYAFIMLYTSYYLFAGRVWLSLAITSSCLLICPIAFGVIFGLLGGLNGVWLGFTLGGVIVAAVSALLIKLREQSKTFPLLLAREKLSQELSYDVPKTTAGIMDLVYRVEQDLGEKAVEKSKINKIMLMIEETQTQALHDSEKGCVIECSIFLEDDITVILRDSGKFSNYLSNQEMDEISRRIIARHSDKRYILTGGKNKLILKY